MSSRWLGNSTLLFLHCFPQKQTRYRFMQSTLGGVSRRGRVVVWSGLIPGVPFSTRQTKDSCLVFFSLINLIEPYFQYLHCHSAVTEMTTTTGEENPCVTNKRGINNGSGPCTCAPSMAGSRSSHLLSLKSDTCNKQIPFEIPQILSLIFSLPITRPPNLYTRRRRHGSVSRCRQTGSVNQGWDGML